MFVQEAGDADGVGDDASDIGSGREGADLQGAVGVLLELVAQILQTDPAIVVLADGDHIGDGLAPTHFV